MSASYIYARRLECVCGEVDPIIKYIPYNSDLSGDSDASYYVTSDHLNIPAEVWRRAEPNVTQGESWWRQHIQEIDRSELGTIHKYRLIELRATIDQLNSILGKGRYKIEG